MNNTVFNFKSQSKVFMALQEARIAYQRVGKGQIYVYTAEVEVEGFKVIAIVHNHTLLGYLYEGKYYGYDWQTSTSKGALGRVLNKYNIDKKNSNFFGWCELDVTKVEEGTLTEETFLTYDVYVKNGVRPMFDAIPDGILVR